MMTEAVKLPEACMFDHSGRRVETWLPEMQSEEFLRASIMRGERTEECWGVLKGNRERARAGLRAIAMSTGIAQ